MLNSFDTFSALNNAGDGMRAELTTVKSKNHALDSFRFNTNWFLRIPSIIAEKDETQI